MSTTEFLKSCSIFAGLTDAQIDAIVGAGTEKSIGDGEQIFHEGDAGHECYLLVDGRVLSAGGGLDGAGSPVNHWDGEIFSPPYLFRPNGSLAPRPEITAAPALARVAASFDVEATPDMADFTLVKMSATTHTMNTDLRFLRAGFSESSPTS